MKRNPSQLRAITHLSGPMMVLAGPGSGKTSVIVERTAYMINEGKIPASSILVVTFSRAAATEMKERFLKFVGGFHDFRRFEALANRTQYAINKGVFLPNETSFACGECPYRDRCGQWHLKRWR